MKVNGHRNHRARDAADHVVARQKPRTEALGVPSAAPQRIVIRTPEKYRTPLLPGHLQTVCQTRHPGNLPPLQPLRGRPELLRLLNHVPDHLIPRRTVLGLRTANKGHGRAQENRWSSGYHGDFPTFRKSQSVRQFVVLQIPTAVLPRACDPLRPASGSSAAARSPAKANYQRTPTG